MHCLGAISGGSGSPQRNGNCAGALGIVRALGVLVSEGRVQGPPKGYREGPHCAAPLQPMPNNHVCEKGNYLCDRYVILVREIADRVTTCSYLCVEVLLCTDCPCGLAKATCKDPVLPIPSMSIASWHKSSEILLEYWCINVVPSKGPETMNNQSLYQAVRSRLHFSQVAAWWSRSKGIVPSYIATRVVSYSEDNFRKFQETPSEHTFPLAACGNGSSIKVTVWALPRMEDIPTLTCPVHQISEKEEPGAARALTPTKHISAPTNSSNHETLVLPILVDDRLQTPCNEPGKHHCRCEDEDGCPPSPSVRTDGERKRRRSLPRGPDFNSNVVPHTPIPASSVLPSVSELATGGHQCGIYPNRGRDCANLNYTETRYPERPSYPSSSTDLDCGLPQLRNLTLPFFSNEHSSKESVHFDHEINTNGDGVRSTSLEKRINMQLSMEGQESNVEKRYKHSIMEPASNINTWVNLASGYRREKSPQLKKWNCLVRSEQRGTNLESTLPSSEGNQQARAEESASTSSSLITLVGLQNSIANINWTTSTISGKETEFGYNQEEKLPSSVLPINTLPSTCNQANVVVNPFSGSSPFHESNPGPSSFRSNNQSIQQTSFFRSSCKQGCICHSTVDKHLTEKSSMDHNAGSNESVKDANVSRALVSNSDLSQLMSNLKLPEETDKDENRVLDWISKVPSRVYNVATNHPLTDYKVKMELSIAEEPDNGTEVKSKQNCNLELSQREFDEVLAVLRARTPGGRRRTALRTIKRRDKMERQIEECIPDQQYDFQVISSNINTFKYNYLMVRPDAAKLYSNSKKHQSINTSEEVDQPEEMHRKIVKNIIHRNETIQQYFAEQSSCAREGRLQSKDVNGGQTYCQMVERVEQLAKPAECFYNVTSKADVLLDAILRTNKDPRKGLSDISNGARPRTVFAAKTLADENDFCMLEAKVERKSVGVMPFEDGKLLPATLNKRISRFKQLFKKQQNKKNSEALASQNYSEQYTANSDKYSNAAKLPTPYDFKLLQKNSKESRVKRRIDFANVSKSTQWYGDHNESLLTGSKACLSTNSIYQNPLCLDISQEAQNSSDCNKITENGKLHNLNKADNSRCSASNSIKHNKNLKLQISYAAIQHDYIEEPIWKENSVTRLICGNEDKRDISLNEELRPNHVDMEINDASDKGVPSASEQKKFRRSLGNAASMVFHSRTGLPLTSSPAPLRRGSCCFDYDSSLNSVSSKRSALFELNTPPSPGAVSLEEGDREAENTCEGEECNKRRTSSRRLPHSHALLGNFEESALNGRLEPVSTVHGFTAELGASGSFCPKHRKLPVTVFFYTLGDNDKVSTPYLAHINLGKKGYQVPRSGTIQVTLLNPLGTVVKMFVVMYDLSDMPSRSHTFLRQRTLRDKTLRYLIHLRFMSGKSGRIYLHTDIRMIICRKSDVDTASDFGAEPPRELRSFVHGPTNPKFSPRR